MTIRHNTDLQRLSSDIRLAAELAEAPYDADAVAHVIECFQYGFKSFPIELRTTTKPRGKRDLSFRFVDLVDNRDAFECAVERGLVQAHGHPVNALVPELRARFDFLGYGVDASARVGFEKIWPFLTQAYPVEEAFAMQAMPQSLRRVETLLREYRLDHFSIVAADYRHRTTNVYFPMVNPEFYTAERVGRLVTDAGFGAPQGAMADLLGQAVFANLTLDWDHDEPVRLGFYLAVPDASLVPRLGDPTIDNYVKNVPFLTERRGVILGPTWGRDSTYVKIENDYTGTIMATFGITLLGERIDAQDAGRRIDLAQRLGKQIPAPADRSLPEFEGLVTDDAGLREEVGRDFGHLRAGSARTVVRPRAVGDLVASVRWAAERGVQVAARGRGHSVFGQAQVPADGLNLDLRTLRAVEAQSDGSVWADAGATFRQVARALQPFSVPAVMPDYLDLSIGGVLSVGGIGGRSFERGLAVDTVQALEVVTGTGEHVLCSATDHADLFGAALGGLGQFGLIARAKLECSPAPQLAHVRRLRFSELGAFIEAQRRAVREGLFDFLEGQVVWEEGRWGFVLDAAGYSPEGLDQRVASLQAEAVEAMTMPFAMLLLRVDVFEQEWRANGAWQGAHPWIDLFVPDEHITPFMEASLARLTPADLGSGVFLVFPFVRRNATPNLAITPRGEVNWLVDILRSSGPGSEMGASHLAANRELFERAVDCGGTHYPIGAVELGPDDHERHYGQRWNEVKDLKRKFDPHGILTPGQSVARALK